MSRSWISRSREVECLKMVRDVAKGIRLTVSSKQFSAIECCSVPMCFNFVRQQRHSNWPEPFRKMLVRFSSTPFTDRLAQIYAAMLVQNFFE